MARPPTPLPHGTQQRIRGLMKKSSSAWEFRRLQCIALRYDDRSADETADIMGLHPSSVRNIWAAFLQEGEAALLGEKRGRARGRAHWTDEQERAFLQPFLARAEQGMLTTVREIHAAHCARRGKTVHLTVTYRLLDRHGWRKVVPRPMHPKSDKAAQETFKVFFPPDRHQGESARAPLWSPFPADVRG